MLVLSCERALPSEVEVIVAPGEDALHGVGRGVARGGSSLFETSATQIVIVTNQTFETTASEVPFHAGVAGDALVTGHGSGDGSLGLALSQCHMNIIDP